MPRSLARLALWLTATIAVIASPRVQAEAPFDFMPISTPIQNDLRITWSSALGCKDTFEKSTELGTWVPLAGPYYGIGQQFQVTVLDAFAPAPNQNPPPAVWSQFVSFSLTKYFGG